LAMKLDENSSVQEAIAGEEDREEGTFGKKPIRV
jgi:hypothetical protein